MKMPSKKVILPMCALALVAAGSFGVAKVSASSDTSGHTSIVQKLADTFHLDKAKVQAVFDEQHKEGEASREAAFQTRLAAAVTDGKLTSAQKDLVLAEHNKLKAELDAVPSTATHTERRAAMDKVRSEAEAWAKANHIDAKWLMAGGRGMGEKFGHGHVMGADNDGETDDDASTATPTPTVTPGV